MRLVLVSFGADSVKRLSASLVICFSVGLLPVGCGRPSAPPTAEILPTATTTTANTSTNATANVETVAAPVPRFAPHDWPGWRGPNRDGVAAGSILPTTWDRRENVLWTTSLPGKGHSSPIILGDRVYLTTADDRARTQSVLAIDATRGRKLWQTDIFDAKNGQLEQRVHQENSQASSTLATDGTWLYVLFLNNQRIWCSALDLEGHEQWRSEVGGFLSKFGFSTSPEIYQGLILITADHDDGGFIAGVRRSDGHVVWRRKRPANASYCSPRVVHIGGKDLVIVSGCDHVMAYDPLSGTELWKTPGTTQATVGTVVTAGDLIIASGGYPEADTVALRADGSVVWRNKDKTYVPSMIVVDGHLYTVQDDGIARCWNAATGKQLWQHRIGGKFRTSLLAADGYLYTTDMSGKTTVFKASPTAFELVAENQLGNEGFASPAVSGDRLFLRVAEEGRDGRNETLYCIGHREEPARTRTRTRPPE